MIRRPPRSTQSRSSAASDVYKRQLGYHNRVVALRLASDGGRDPEIPAPSDRAELGPLSLAPSVRHLRQVLARESFDVVLGHGGWATQVAALARGRDRVPIVWQRI